MFNRVAIIGLGLIGGSIGLALHKAKAAQQITGYDLAKGISNQARKIGAIDQPYSALADAVRGAELVILATPVGARRFRRTVGRALGAVQADDLRRAVRDAGGDLRQARFPR